ncbi:MAG: VOC family protein [Cyanobacteria bacterium P01_A01_bin.114]
MRLARLDHLVLTVQDIEATCQFYTQVLGMGLITFGQNRKALRFGQQKINLHLVGQEFEPKAQAPKPGSADLCFLTETPLADVIDHLEVHKIPIIEGPVQRTGTLGPILSVYIRDPDGNLLEIAYPM